MQEDLSSEKDWPNKEDVNKLVALFMVVGGIERERTLKVVQFILGHLGREEKMKKKMNELSMLNP